MGAGRGLDVVGLLVPPVGGDVFAEGEVVEVEAVGGGLSGASGVLPPEACPVVGVGQLQYAGQR
ncbi:hypothetical protein [Streptomyces sp. NPDC059209]|uniref:hypothetical protein n=1 Tax=Streptomyces sp. NPDC059209 TaxID=3346769 RepID=UPI0036A52F95